MCASITVDLQRINPKDSIAASLLAQSAVTETLPLIDTFLRMINGYDEVLLNTFLSAIESRGLIDSSALGPYLAEESSWRKSVMSIWLVARLLELSGETEQALHAWDQVINGGSGPIHEAFLSRARLWGQQGCLEQAFADLRLAVQSQEDYTFLTKAARLLTRLRSRGIPALVRKIRLALLSSSTTDLMSPLLQLACFRDGIDAEIYVAPYGNYQQEILNPESGLYTFKPDFVLIATHWRDANLTAFSNNTDEEVRRVVHELQQLWKILLQRQPCRIIQHGFNLPAQDSYGHLSGVLPGGRLNMLREINRALVQAAPSPVALLDLDRASAQFGRHKWFDPTYWHLAKQYPSANALPLLVDHQVALIRAGLGLTKKVLALDLDNTLWGGVIGEDGLEGIRLGPPSAVGEAYQALQQYVLELKARGIVLVVCSKNNEEDAKQPFLHHDATVLHLDDFVVFRANWVDKPTNLRDIARMLNLGIDSFVFLDDNPVERALVRRELPEVAVPEVGVDPVTFVPTLDRGLYFEAWSLSQEDMERHESYRANVLRDELAKLAGSLEDFLADLQMEAEIGAFDNSVLARVVQLIGKTNQFNVTTRRYSEEQVRRMMASDNYWTQHFKLNDRFGDNGLIGVMIARQVLADLPTWEIDTWLMSCRVIGRQMEQFMLQTLVEAAQTKGVRTIRGVYIPTAKNAMVSDLYSRLGFTRLSETASGEVQYLLDLKEQVVPRCAFIRPRNAPLAALPKIG